MKKYFYIVLIAPMFALAQVGINTTTPAAQLDIKSSNQATPANTDGILIPKIDAFPAVNPTAAQKGMLVYLTTASGANQPGFYFWNDPGWVGIVSGSTGGTLDQSYDFGGAGAGKTITADTGAVTIAGTDGLVSTGTLGTGALVPSGSGIRMVWNPRKGAFRAGSAGGTGWNDASTGDYSVAFGEGNIASGLYSSAFGNANIASGSFSAAFGSSNTASGIRSVAFGLLTTAGSFAASFGRSTTANGISSASFGNLTIADGENATVFGRQSSASGLNAIAAGQSSTASGTNSLVLGSFNTASGSGSLAAGDNSTASGVNSIAMGEILFASGRLSTVLGKQNTSPSYGETVLGIGATTYTPSLSGDLQFRSANSTDRLFVVGNAIDANNNNFVDLVERSDALVILKNGNTGIGSSTPQDKLHVVGNIRMVDGNQGAGKVLTSDANGTATWQTPAAVAETDPQVSSTTTGRVPRWNGSTLSDGILFDDATNIGIGTTTPTDKLHVVGNIRMVDGNQGSGKVLTSNANGTATWQTPAAAGTTLDGAYDFGGAGAGRTITADAGAVTIDGTDGLVSIGTTGSGALAPSGDGTRMVWNPRKAAFRAGTVTGGSAEWDDSSIGIGSVAMGSNTIASGDFSVAMGDSNSATDRGATAFGNNTFAALQGSTAFGNNTIAGNASATAMGTNSRAFGASSTTMGFNTFASNTAATAMGMSTTASGIRSTAIGDFTTASGDTSISMGGGTMASGKYSTAMGESGTASGETSSVMGRSNMAPSYSETVLGIGATTYTPSLNGATQFRTANATDRLFVVGNAIDANNNNIVDPAERSDALIILKNGNTGIGSSTPQDKLHIVGNIRMVDGNQGAGKVLTSDVNGTATWQTPTSGNSWSLIGNAGTNSSSNFIGTTDDQDVVFKRFNTTAGRLGTFNTSFGNSSMNLNSSGTRNTAFGVLSLSTNSTGNNNVAIGYNALLNSLSSENTAVGANSLQTNNTGISNAAVGFNALKGNSSGNSNVAIGHSAMENNSTGNFNSALGFSALNSNSIGINNVAVGANSLFSNNASENTASGANSLINNTTGTGNAAFGYNAAQSNNGDFNVSVGHSSLFSNSSGNRNTALGTLSLFSSIGNDNVAVGYNSLTDNTSSEITAVGSNSLENNTSGIFNAAVGFNSLKANTTGSNNTATGHSSLLSNTTGNMNSALGFSALSSNTNGSNNVAIGGNALPSSNASENTAVGVNAMQTNTSGLGNAALGTNALFQNQTGQGNAGVGYFSLNSNISGSLNTGLGYFANVADSGLINATAVGANAYVGASNSLVLGSINGVNSAFSDTNVGIGTTTPQDRLHVVGNIRMVDGGQAVGKVLTSDANGRATWQNPTTGAETDPQVSSTTTGRVPRWNGTTLNDGALYDDATNIGIGTSTPAARLHVVGNIRMVDGNQATGKVLTSDANGTATWQTPATVGNTLDGAYDFGGSGAGRTITADSGAVTIAGTDGLVSTGTPGSGVLAPTGTGTRMVWNPNKAAFRAGTVSGTQWDNANIGISSFAAGENTLASGNRAIALGFGSMAMANNSLALGTNNQASGVQSAAIGGSSNIAGGIDSFATGTGNTALGVASNVMGRSNTATSFGETVIGIGATTYTPSVNGDSQFRAANSTDRLLVVGNAIDANNNNIVETAERSDALVILKNGNTGIGSSTPQTKLHLVDANKVTSNTGEGNLHVVTNDAQNTDIGGSISLGGFGSSTTTASVFGTIEGRKSNAGALSDSGYLIFKTNSVSTLTERMRITNTGNVGVGTTTPGGQFELSLDQGRKPTTNTWTVPSDARLKEVHGAYEKGLAEILQLRPIRYHYINTSKKTFDQKVLDTEACGFLAQEVQPLFPEAVGNDEDGYLNFNIHPILIASVNALKELNAKNNQLESENQALKASIQELNNKVLIIMAEIEQLKK